MSEENKDVMLVNTNNKLIQSFQRRCGQALISIMGNEANAKRFVSSMQVCIARNPKLMECTEESIRNVFLQCAEWQLYPSTVTGECYVIPYKIKGVQTATFQLGYQGMVTLGYRAGVKNITTAIIYQNDDFEYEFGLNPTIKHKPDLFSANRGDAIGAYAIAILESGNPIYVVMSKHDIFKFRDKSQSWQADKKYKKKDSPWQESGDPMLTMWQKTVLRQLFKMMPKTPQVVQAINADIEGDVIDIPSESEPPTVAREETTEPINDNLSEADRTAFILRLSKDEGYSDAEIKEAMKQVTGKKNPTNITSDQAEEIEGQLVQNRDMAAAQQECNKEGQQELYDE